MSHPFCVSRSRLKVFVWSAFALFVAIAFLPSTLPAQNVLTYKYNNARDGQNTNETTLTPANVNVNIFSKWFTYTVDGYVYSEPLYVKNVSVPGKGTHDVVYVTTENDSVYAFDANNNGAGGGLLWQTNLGIALLSTNYGVRYHHNVLNPLIGITGTSVIDPTTGTLYVDTFCGTNNNNPFGFHVLHALNITNGLEQSYSPVLVQASVPGRGLDATNGIVTFAPRNCMNRPALTLAGGMLFVAYGSYGDADPYHGWVITYNPTNFQQLPNYTFATTPNATVADFGTNGAEGAIWMSGSGPCVDNNTNIYFEVANGSFSAQTNGGDYGDSFVKLSTTNNGFAVGDYFTPWDQASMAVNDLDLGSGGPILLPDSVGSGAHPHLIVGAGKEGTIYLVDCDNMGKYIRSTNTTATKDTQIAQELQSVLGSGVWGSPAYFNNEIFFQGTSDSIKGFGITNGVITSTPLSKTTTTFGDGYTTPSVSANGTSNAIVWIIQTDAFSGNGPAILHAYNATNLSQELYNSSQNLGRDNPGAAVKYAVPVVADGKVFVRGEFSLSVFGVGRLLPPPTISPNGGVYTNSITVTLSDTTNTAAIYYTLNGSAPTTNSTFYIGPFTLTNSAAVNAIAILNGTNNSAIASASFINSSEIGNGIGLKGEYFTNHTSANPYTGSPILVTTDAVVNFNWSTNGPAQTVGTSNFTVRWTGTIQPQFSEVYTLLTTTDDGVRLWINGHLLIDKWVNGAATTYSNSIFLKAQQLYNIEMDYFQAGGSASAELQWSSPSTPLQVVPQTQLYPFTNPPPAVAMAAPNNGAVYTGNASVTVGANADALYNPISEVDFYANNSLIGTVNQSSQAPFYAVTTPGFSPNPGGETGISTQASATPVSAVNLTTTNVQPQGPDWTAAIWQTNGTGTAVPPVAGNTYTMVFNGTSIGNGLNNTRVRSPALAGTQTFPGNSLTVNTNAELRIKSTVANFPGVGGRPGLIFNGGMLNMGNDGSGTITGSIQVNGVIYDSAGGNNGGGGGLSPNPRTLAIAGNLSGNGTFVLINCCTNLPETISGSANTFSGPWIVQCGWLQAATANSLGSNSITVDPLYSNYLAAMPNATSPTGPALFEVNYDLVSSGSLTLANGGMMNLHQNCTFTSVNIAGAQLGPGTHSYAELALNFPGYFLPGGSGSITVSPAPATAPPAPSAPTGLTATAGNALVNLLWNAVPGATNYNVKRSTSNGGPYTTIGHTSSTTYTDPGLANGTTYFYVVTAVAPPGYQLLAVATDASGLSSTSAPVNITINSGSASPYGMTTNGTVAAFLNGTMPGVIPPILPGTLPATLSGTGAYGDTTNRVPTGGLIPYVPNTPLWSDNAVKSRYLALPGNGGAITPDEQITFAPTNSWTFPAGTVFVKNFDLVVNETNSSAPLRRLETRLLVRDNNGQVYGVTYKWHPDNSDADLLLTSTTEDILITNSSGVRTQTWYYPSPADCLTCHTPVANYVLGVSTRQLNGNLTYPSTGNTDNQLRTLNRLGLFYPAIDEGTISSLAQMASLTNLSASLEQRSRSYLDANCAQCHQPGGTGITFDARYDTSPTNQYITNYPAQLSLGIDNPCIVKGQDIWRSMIYQRINTTNATTKMPPLARNLIDTNAVAVLTAWINSLPGTPALAPPTIIPNGGTFSPSVTVTLQPPDPNATLFYTLDGTLPNSNSFMYSAPFVLSSNATVSANAFEINSNNSIAASAIFVIASPHFTSEGFVTNGVFQLGFAGAAGSNYVLLTSTDLLNWAPISTNLAGSSQFFLIDSNAAGPRRFYRVLQP